MKRKVLLALLFFILLGSTGCSIVIDHVGNESLNKIWSKYAYFTGTKERSIKVKEGKPIEVSAKITSKSGTLNIKIYKDTDKDNCIYEGKDVKTSKFKVSLTEPGRYILKIVAKKHKGEFTFSW